MLLVLHWLSSVDMLVTILSLCTFGMHCRHERNTAWRGICQTCLSFLDPNPTIAMSFVSMYSQQCRLQFELHAAAAHLCHQQHAAVPFQGSWDHHVLSLVVWLCSLPGHAASPAPKTYDGTFCSDTYADPRKQQSLLVCSRLCRS